MKHLLKLLDLSTDEILQVITLAEKLKYELHHRMPHRLLEGRTIALIFEKASTRTRTSFEVGAHQLGAYGAYMNVHDLQIGRGEPIQDTARVLSRYFDAMMIRTFGQDVPENLAKFGSIPVINGLTDFAHPGQVLADLMTIREKKGGLTGRKLCYIGDGNNMANSLIVGGLKTGMAVSVACPAGYTPDRSILEFAQDYPDFELTDDPILAAKNADALYTDVWASMGQEGEAEQRKKVFAGYQINDDTLRAASAKAMVLHCLPAHRGEEITAEAFEAHADEIFEEAENRLHIHKAVMVTLMADR